MPARKGIDYNLQRQQLREELRQVHFKTNRAFTGKILYQNNFDTIEDTNDFQLMEVAGANRPEGYFYHEKNMGFKKAGCFAIINNAGGIPAPRIRIGLIKNLKKLTLEFYTTMPRWGDAKWTLRAQALPGEATDRSYDAVIRLYQGAFQYGTGASPYTFTSLADAHLTRIGWQPAQRDWNRLWHYIKIIADFSTKKYVSLQLNDKTWNLSNVDLGHADDQPTPYAIIIEFAITDGANRLRLLIDDLILTEEP